jgi:hypothetical protein
VWRVFKGLADHGCGARGGIPEANLLSRICGGARPPRVTEGAHQPLLGQGIGSARRQDEDPVRRGSRRRLTGGGKVTGGGFVSQWGFLYLTALAKPPTRAATQSLDTWR